MSSPLILVENLISTVAFPNHAFTADEYASGHEPWRVADGRRSTYYTALTANQQRILTLTQDRVRGANCTYLWPGHNLSGLTIPQQVSHDNVTWETEWSVTLPSATVTNNASDTAYGVRTEEGGWLLYYAPTNPPAGIYRRWVIPAMGAGKIPVIVGLTVGMAWDPGLFWTPWSEDNDDLSMTEIKSAWGHSGRDAAVNARVGTLGIKLATDDAYDLARYHLTGHFGHGRPMVLCYDQAQADRAFVVRRPQGQAGFAFAPNWWPRQAVNLSYAELDPLRAT